jgi:hypothetical protein
LSGNPSGLKIVTQPQTKLNAADTKNEKQYIICTDSKRNIKEMLHKTFSMV